LLIRHIDQCLNYWYQINCGF